MGALADVILQAGHAAWTSSSGYAYPVGGGAPGEAQWAWDLAHLMVPHLNTRGVGGLVVGQWYNHPPPPEAATPATLFVSLHYDAAVYGEGRNTGAFADRWLHEPATTAPVCDRFVSRWQTTYAAATGIPVVVARRNPNTNLYYAYSAVQVAPAVLLEHGCGSPVPTQGKPRGQDSLFLHGQIGRVAATNAGIVLAHLVAEGTIPPLPPEEVDVSILSDDQAIAAATELWAQRGQTFVPGFAIPDAWLRRWRDGAYAGLPQTGELESPAMGDARVQAFDLAAAAYLPGQPVSWEA